MKLSFNREKSVSTQIWWLFLVAALSLITTLGIVYIKLNHVIDTIAETRRLRVITDELALLGENLIDVETGQRGYLITRDLAYLQPYQASKSQINHRLDLLNQLVKDPIVKAHLTRLVPIIQARMEVAANMIALLQQGHINEATDMVISGRGKALMDEFRRIRADMLTRELNILNQYKKSYERNLLYVLLSLVIGGALAVMLMLVSALITTRSLKKPILNLLDGIRAMTEGRHDYQVNIIKRDEIGRISMAFNEMAANILEGRKVKEEILADLQRWTIFACLIAVWIGWMACWKACWLIRAWATKQLCPRPLILLNW